jgi:hypothetical protein
MLPRYNIGRVAKKQRMWNFSTIRNSLTAWAGENREVSKKDFRCFPLENR